MGGPRAWRVATAGLAVLLALQAARAFFPIAFRLGEETDFIGAGVFALAVFAAPILAPAMRRLLGPRRGILAALGLLAALRLAVQLVHPIPLWLATLLTVAALLALASVLVELLVSEPAGGLVAAAGFFAGLALDTGIRGAFLTWDVLWQDGLLAAAVSVALVLGLVGAAWTSDLGRGSAATAPPAPAVAVLGPFLMLQVLYLQSPAYAASQAGVSIATATALVLVGDALALLLIGASNGGLRTSPVRDVAFVALVAVGYALPRLPGGAIVVVLLVGQLLAAGALGSGLAPGRERPPSPLRLGGGLAAGAVGFLGLVLLFQIHYEIPLPVSNRWLPPLATILLGLGLLRRPAPTTAGVGEPRRTSAVAAGLPVLLLLIPAAVWLARPDAAFHAGSRDRVRLVDYNIHLGVDVDGQLNPEAIARAIEAQDPDVVVLQEVGRGWAIGGSVDLAGWLAYRLDLSYRFQPAADRQFGNAILSRVPILASEGARLPFGEGPQRRSYLRVTLDLGDGRTLEVFGAHLQHQEMTDTRLMQIEALLAAWDGASPAVIAGDINAQPNAPEIQRFTEEGLLSAQDETGNGDLATASEPAFPGDRVDWIFGAGVGFEDFEIPQTRASDHLPLVVTVVVG